MVFNLQAQIQFYLNGLEERGLLTRTFRRLDYARQIIVLKSVLAEALESGPASVSVKRVAHRAGVSVGSLYQYFGNRTKMVECVFELSANVSRNFCEQLTRSLISQPLDQALAGYVKQAISIGAEEPALLTLWSKAIYEGNNTVSERWVKPISFAIHDLFRTILINAQDKGELLDDIDIEATTGAFYALTTSFFDSCFLPHINAFFGMSHPGSDPSSDWSRLSNVLLFGICKVKATR